MICILALIVFGILGIFSASHRKMAVEAFDCVFRRITMRKCRTNLDKRLKSQLVGKLMRKNKNTARFMKKYFEVFSWIFLLLLLASIVGVGYSGYMYLKWGNCNGPESDEFCVFDSLKGPSFSEQEASVCGAHVDKKQALSTPDVSQEEYVGRADAPITLIEFGCYSCHYTKEAQDVVERILDEYGDNIRFYWLQYPIATHENSMEAAIASECARIQGNWHEYHEGLFGRSPDIGFEDLEECCTEVGIEKMAFDDCLHSQEARDVVDRHLALGSASGVYGTPTFFINGKPLVGPKSYDRMEKEILEALE